MYQSIAATSTTLQQLVLDFMEADAGPAGLASFFGGVTTVSLATPQEMMSAGRRGLSVWLYRVVRDENRLNDPPGVRQLPTGDVELTPPPLPLRLHYLLTPLADSQADTEQRILGRAMQFFHSHPILAGSMLRGELMGTDTRLHVHLEALGLDEITRVWEALGGSYQLSVSYEVTLVRISAETVPTQTSIVESVQPEYSLIVGRGGQ